MPRISINHITSAFLLLFSLGLKAQSPDQLLKIGDELYEKGEYYGSIEFYKKAFLIDSVDAEILYKYGRNLGIINSHEKASRYLLKSALLGGDDLYPSLNFELAQAYHQSGEYRKARRYYNRAIRPYRSDRKSLGYKIVDRAKDAAEWADKNQQVDPNTTVENLGIQNGQRVSEFAPHMIGNKLYFTAIIADSVQGSRILDKEYLGRIYTKVLNSEEMPNALLFESKNHKLIANKHVANLCFAEDKQVYFSLCDTNFKCEIYKAKLVGKLLIEPEVLNKNINFPGANNTMPQYVKIDNEEHLIFVSNRPKGFGGLDIWVSRQESFGFGEAKNLGGEINSPLDEISPYYEVSERALYFSSNWHNGYGGYDIFKSEGVPPKMARVENLGLPINSPQNDLYFHPYQDSALFSSNRILGNLEGNASCCNEIFKVNYQLQPFEEEKEDTAEAVVVNVNVLNKYLPLELFFHNDIPKPNQSDTTTDANYLSLAYEYLELEGEYMEQFEGYALNEEQIDQLGNFFDDEVSKSVALLEEFTPLLLAELEKGNQITLNVKGFASSLSNSEYNLKLTLRRIESLVNYLRSYRNGVFIPYLEANASNGGKLEVRKLPYGEFTVEREIDESDKRMSVYSYEAAKQRKIQLIGITQTETGRKKLGENEDFDAAKIALNTQQYDLGTFKKGPQIKRTFLITNEGTSDLLIYNLVKDFESSIVEYPAEMAAKDKSQIEITIPTTELEAGIYNFSYTIVSNAERNLMNLSIKVEITE